jgi:transcriptional regulator with PAS, ATPase and Fis domain
MNKKKIFEYLITLAENVASGVYEAPDELFELTKDDKFPIEVGRLAEAFGMMLVKVEAREFLLEKTIRELRKSKNELELMKNLIEEQNIHLKDSLRKNFAPPTILGISKAIKNLQETIKRISDTPVNVLISGESGTGKELVAKSLHYSGIRASEPFIAINCGALPETLLESELFGIEKGVATGVDKRVGKIEIAGSGTIFLDEIGEMSLSAQIKLLRALQERVIEKIGSTKPVKVNARFVAATNKNLLQEIKKGNFREDLYYRLKVIHINIPPLRERVEDIPLLFRTFIDMYSKRYGRMVPFSIRKDTMNILQKYPWPGNIRELENEAERIAVLAYDSIITPDVLSDEILNFYRKPKLEDKYNQEIREIEDALKLTKGNKTAAAKLLGISREGLRKKMIRLGMSDKK